MNFSIIFILITIHFIVAEDCLYFINYTNFSVVYHWFIFVYILRTLVLQIVTILLVVCLVYNIENQNYTNNHSH